MLQCSIRCDAANNLLDRAQQRLILDKQKAG